MLVGRSPESVARDRARHHPLPVLVITQTPNGAEPTGGTAQDDLNAVSYTGFHAFRASCPHHSPTRSMSAYDAGQSRWGFSAVNNDVVIESSGPVVTLRLNRPAKHNAITADMYESLARAMAAVEPAVTPLVVLRGSGTAFT